MISSRRAWQALALFVVTGCNGKVFELGAENVPDAASSPSPGAGITPSASCTGFERAPRPTSVEESQRAITGRWAICGRGFPPPPSDPADAAGIEFAGSKAYFLVRDQGGHLVRGPGDYERGLRVIDEGDRYSLCLDDLGGAQCLEFEYSTPAGFLHLLLAGHDIDLDLAP